MLMRIRDLFDPVSGIRDRKNSDPGSGWKKFGSGIRDYPGSATLLLCLTLTCPVMRSANSCTAAGRLSQVRLGTSQLTHRARRPSNTRSYIFTRYSRSYVSRDCVRYGNRLMDEVKKNKLLNYPSTLMYFRRLAKCCRAANPNCGSAPAPAMNKFYKIP
jgi:hypothetical protein